MAQGITVATQEVGIMEVISGAGTMEVILVGGITEVCWERSHKICQALRQEREKALGSRETDGPFALQSNVLKSSAGESPGVGAGQASWPAN